MRVNNFVPSLGNCRGLVEGHLVIDFSALEMARLAPGLKDWLDLGVKVGLYNRCD